MYEYCEYGSDIATSYGAGAFVLLLTSQVIIMVASRCFCCGKSLNPGGSRACAIMLFLICWYCLPIITTSLAFMSFCLTHLLGQGVFLDC